MGRKSEDQSGENENGIGFYKSHRTRRERKELKQGRARQEEHFTLYLAALPLKVLKSGPLRSICYVYRYGSQSLLRYTF